MPDLVTKLEALLFAEGEPVSKKKLTSLLNCSIGEIDAAAEELAHRRKDTALSVLRTDSEVALAIAPIAAKTVEDAFSRELGREIGDAGLEVLAIILYRGPSTRAQIDYIRGVNTSSTIRTLAARGLIERIPNPKDGREYLYKPTADLLAHLGAPDARSLPEYDKITGELAAFEAKSGPFENHDESTGNTDTSDGSADD
ncbi:MAG TPA: SMC-Scp complex subunit ScpB [Candidatus Paceibacterota bacterium]